MARILDFPKQDQETSIGYHNLSRLIDSADSLAELGFYAEWAVVGDEDGKYFPGEYAKLGEQIRKKYNDMLEPRQGAVQKATDPGLYVYCPELGESCPECQMEARFSYFGSHYYIKTPLELKGRGIVFLDATSRKNSDESDKEMVVNRYRTTERAFEKLKEQYSISMKNLLD